MSRFLNLMPSPRSSGVDLPRLLLDLNLHRLPAPVVAAVPAHSVRQLRLVTLRALAVRGQRSLPRRSPRVPPRPACLPLRYCHGSLPSVVQLELVQDLPPGIDIRPAGALAEVAIPAAPLAQSQAVRPAQRRERHPQDHRVAHHRLEVDVALGHGVLVGLIGCTRREQLTDLDPELFPERLQAPGAPVRYPPRQRPAHLDALDDGGECDLQADRLLAAGPLGSAQPFAAPADLLKGLIQLLLDPGQLPLLGIPDLGDLLERPGQRGLERRQLLIHVVLGLVPDLSSLPAGLLQDPLRLLDRGLHDLLLGQQLRLLLQGVLDDRLGVLSGLGEELLPVLHHPPGLLDLLREGRQHLLHELEGLLAVDQHRGRQGHRLRLHDQLLELLDPSGDVHYTRPSVTPSIRPAAPSADAAPAPEPGRTHRRRTGRSPSPARTTGTTTAGWWGRSTSPPRPGAGSSAPSGARSRSPTRPEAPSRSLPRLGSWRNPPGAPRTTRPRRSPGPTATPGASPPARPPGTAAPWRGSRLRPLPPRRTGPRPAGRCPRGRS